MGKWRFTYRQPHAIHRPTYCRVELALHLFRESFCAAGGSADQVGYLPNLRSLRMAQALAAKLTFTNQILLITHQQDLQKEAGDLFVHRGNKIGNGGEMRPAVGRQGHEDNVLLTAFDDISV